MKEQHTLAAQKFQSANIELENNRQVISKLNEYLAMKQDEIVSLKNKYDQEIQGICYYYYYYYYILFIESILTHHSSLQFWNLQSKKKMRK